MVYGLRLLPNGVSKFMRATLMRNNIDGVGGAMVSSINCIRVSESVGGLVPETQSNALPGDADQESARFFGVGRERPCQTTTCFDRASRNC